MPILLKNLISERRSVSLDVDKAKSLLQTSCSESLNLFKQKKRIYRGIKLDSIGNSILYTNPKTSERYSKDTHNLYTVLMSYLPSWNGWPKRSYSIMMTCNKSNANSYGNPFIVFPYNNSKFVESNVDDILSTEAFPHFRQIVPKEYEPGRMTEFKTIVEIADTTFYRKWLNTKHSIRMDNIKQFLDELNATVTLDKLKDVTYKGNYSIDIFNFNSKTPWTDLLNDLFDPEKNGFKLKSIEELDFHGDFEIWTDSECILINHDEEDILNSL